MAHKLVGLARQTWLSRDTDTLTGLCEAIVGLPVDPKIQNIGRFYRAHCLTRMGQVGLARDTFERVADTVATEYQPRVILALSFVYDQLGLSQESAAAAFEAALAAKATDDVLTRCQALETLAFIRGAKGDHNGALADLHRLLPVKQWLRPYYPADYYYYLNNLAYEMGAVGRIDEANHIIDIALRSPFATGFPNWQETKDELITKTRRAFTPLIFAIGKWNRFCEHVGASPEEATVPKPAAQTDPSPAERARFAKQAHVIPVPRAFYFHRNFTSSAPPEWNRAALPLVLSGYDISPPARAPPAVRSQI